MTIRVLVADDQSMVRAGFRMLLAEEADIEVVAEASNGLDAITHPLQKLDVRDRVQAVVLAHETGIFDGEARSPADRQRPR